jgi:hypothetical protein
MKAAPCPSKLQPYFCPCWLSILLLFVCTSAFADEWVYDDSLHFDESTVSGWQNWGSGGIDLGNTSVVRSGSRSIAVNLSDQYFMLGHYPYPFDISSFSEIKFSINGGAIGGSQLYLIFAYTDSPLVYFQLPAIQANTWQDITFSLTSPGSPANRTDFQDMIIDDFSNVPGEQIYLDDIRLVQVPEPGTAALLALAVLSMAFIQRRQQR